MNKHLLCFVVVFSLSIGMVGQFTPATRHGVDVTQPDAAPLINFGGLSGANLSFTDSAYDNVKMTRCTDAYSNSAHTNFSYSVGLEGSGDKNSWSSNDGLLQISDEGGNSYIFRVLPTSTNACSPVCFDGDADQHCSGSVLRNFGPGVFSRINPETYYSYYWTVQYKIVPVTIPPAGTAPSAGTAVADFSPALYKSGAPAWAMGSSYTVGQVILPTGGGNLSLFQVTSAGTGGSVEPNWSATAAPQNAGTLTILPVPDWPGAGKSVALNTIIQPTAGDACKCLFSATTPGMTGGSEPSPWNQAVSGQQMDGQVIWTNLNGTSLIKDGGATLARIGQTTTEMWQDPGGVENSDHLFAMALSYTGLQDTGDWALVYDNSANVIYQLNTFTGIETDFTCTGGFGSNCAGGSWVATVVGTASYNHYTIHNSVLSLGNAGYLVLAVGQACLSCSGNYVPRFWQYGHGVQTSPQIHGDGHFSAGVSNWVNQDGPATVIFETRKYATPATYNPIWSGTCCNFDSHLSWVNNRGQDQEPLIGTTTVGATKANEYPHKVAAQDEIVALAACGQTGEPSCPSGYQTNVQWRLGRNFNFATNSNNFYSWVSTGAVSQTGKYYALTSTGLGTMGSSSGGSSCLGGFTWANTHVYTTGAEITPNPLIANGSDYVFKASCTGSCTSGTIEPKWSQDGTTAVYDNNQITWTPQGVTNCRSDVLIYTLPVN